MAMNLRRVIYTPYTVSISVDLDHVASQHSGIEFVVLDMHSLLFNLILYKHPWPLQFIKKNRLLKLQSKSRGARWLSGRVLEWRSRGCGFEPHRRHCAVSLSKTLCPLLSTGSTQEDPSQHK